MSLSEMSQSRLRAWSVALIWSLAGAGFLLVFFSGGGPGEFDTDSGRHLAGAVAIGFGFVGWWVSLWLTRSRGGGIAADERDMQVVARAGHSALVIVCVGIFALAITLWTVYEEAGVVPVGWMWLMAYLVVILAAVSNSILFLILDAKWGGRE